MMRIAGMRQQMLRNAWKRKFAAANASSSVLVLVERNDIAEGTAKKQTVAQATMSALAAATSGPFKGMPLTVLAPAFADAKAEGAAIAKELAASVPKGTKVLVAAGAASSPELTARALAKVVRERKVSHVIAASTASGRTVLPYAAGILDVAPVGDVIKIEAKDKFVRPVYAGNALCTLTSDQETHLIAVRTTSFSLRQDAAAAAAAASDALETEILPAEAGNTSTIDAEGTASERKSKANGQQRPELPAARVVIAGGRALKSAENFDKLLGALADRFGEKAAIGASRAAVDAGYADNALQIGQTGKVVAPELYVGIGISGAIQHLAGMKDSKVIVAINNDAEAPLFQIADYGIAGDLFSVVPELTRKL